MESTSEPYGRDAARDGTRGREARAGDLDRVESVRETAARLAPALALLPVFLAVWEAFVAVTGVQAVILPSPVDVAVTGARTAPVLLGDAAVTAVTAGAGLLAGCAIGLSLAFLAVRSRVAAAAVRPPVVALRIAPILAIAPLVFLWFGHGVPARALLVTTLTVFPVTIASIDGLRSVRREYLDLVRSVDARPAAAFLYVRLPAAAPSVLAGVKLAAALGVVGAVVAEFVAFDAGLGYRILSTARTLRTPETFAALFVLALLGLGFYSVPALLQRRLLRYR